MEGAVSDCDSCGEGGKVRKNTFIRLILRAKWIIHSLEGSSELKIACRFGKKRGWLLRLLSPLPENAHKLSRKRVYYQAQSLFSLAKWIVHSFG